MNIAKLVMIALHSNAVCQLTLYAYQGKTKEALARLHNICNRPTLWLLWGYFIPKGDTVTSLCKSYPNIFNLLCV
jgi:hypothetical protein